MVEWLVEIETENGAKASADDLERFAAALDAARDSTGAATSLEPLNGVVAATFAVDAADAVEAAQRGVATFCSALTGAGLGDRAPTRVTLERAASTEAA